jgi:hypothetical protein
MRRERRRRGKRPASFLMNRMRVRHIAKLVQGRHGGLPDTDDRDLYLVAVAWHLHGDDRVFALDNWCRRYSYADVPLQEIKDIIGRTKPRWLKADVIGKFLRVTYAERQQRRIFTIGCYDMTKAEREELRKKHRRLKDRDHRRQKGAKPHAQSDARLKPWIDLGMSRRSWYRAGKPTEAPRPHVPPQGVQPVRH